ncbi:cysteine desulfurase family protein [Alicyclobacillus sp.]|uniref:cysteine desulfurase family protein n=1 Tax=Alicyclobacillus sp. TaxID=61169 RepID=UPI0025BA4986|nr:cysteine desulfurase family protein [Alicyclobacillus sp.]MCL6515957.1 cysteine desulfurase [Alicyclobacillus sp.]
MVYLDNAATTPLLPAVHEAMAPYLEERFGNPSSIHRFGRQARAGVEAARRQVAQAIGAMPEEVVFTSGGTESIHLALVGAWLAAGERRHIVTSQAEHHAVLHTCRLLEQLGAEVTRVRPRPDGGVDADEVLGALRPDTGVVSLMRVNNETGAVTAVDAIARAVKARNPDVVVHSDMVQALSALPVELKQSAVDLASFSAHKVHGPKGVGALYVRRGSRWQPVLVGGNQERGRRAGTENAAGIVGFGAAVAHLAEDPEHGARVRRARDAFLEGLAGLAGVVWNSPASGVPTILNLAFSGVRADILLMRLDLEGVAASAGAACTAGSLEPSHVLMASGHPEDRVRSSVRFSFSALTSPEDAARAGRTVRRVVEVLRG